MSMNDQLFAELMTSIDEAGRIVRGETAPARTFTVEPASLVAAKHPDAVWDVLRERCRSSA